MADANVSGLTARVLFVEPAEAGRASGLIARTVVQTIAEEARASTLQTRALWGDSGGVFGRISSLMARVIIKFGAEARQLRAWPFTQDDHDFYVLQLGDFGTLVFDKYSGQWAQWKSPGYDHWRGNDGVAWEGFNVTCDTQSGILWEIDPEGRLDDDVTPITSIVTGGLSRRLRSSLRCNMAELSVSEGRPPDGFEAEGDTTITLRTSSNEGQTYINHGTLDAGAAGADTVFRWYGLGLVSPPGMLFELTDTGYARRIDGFNVELDDG